jgi:hypothetical protein
MDRNKRITKEFLLEEIDKAWKDLNRFLDNLSSDQMTAITDSQGWNVKDHLSHIAAWERSINFFLQGKERFDGLGIGTPHTGSRTAEQFRRWRFRSIYSSKSKLRSNI